MQNTDEEFAATLDLARKCGVIIVQNRNGGIKLYVKTKDKRRSRGNEVGGFELKRRLARVKP